MTKTMATLISLPHEVQDHISNFLRPHGIFLRVQDCVASTEIKIDPFSKAPGVASIKAIHRNFKAVPLWKNHEWKKRIHEWRDENLTKMRWKYQHGVLPDEMIKKGWERKINNDYRHQDCYVETMFGFGGKDKVPKEHKVIWFEVSLHDLVTGIRPLPHCFGDDGNNDWRADGGNLQLTAKEHENWVPAPTLDHLIPINKRREWLIECFMGCVLGHWEKKMVEKNGGAGEKPDFIKEFKNMMDLPSDYELSQTYLFRMFLRELRVRSDDLPINILRRDNYKSSQNIEELCRQEINLVK